MYLLINGNNEIVDVARNDEEFVQRFKRACTHQYIDWLGNNTDTLGNKQTFDDEEIWVNQKSVQYLSTQLNNLEYVEDKDELKAYVEDAEFQVMEVNGLIDVTSKDFKILK